jgi:hypothetical protein
MFFFSIVTTTTRSICLSHLAERLDRMDWQETWNLYGAFCCFMGRIFIEIVTVLFGGRGASFITCTCAEKGEER